MKIGLKAMPSIALRYLALDKMNKTAFSRHQIYLSMAFLNCIRNQNPTRGRNEHKIFNSSDKTERSSVHTVSKWSDLKC